MSNAEESITIPANGKLELAFQVTRNGSVVDTSGWTAKMHIRPRKGSSVLLAEYSTDPGGFLTASGSSGQILVDVPASTTAGYTWKSGVYDVLVTDTSGNRYRLKSGNAFVSAGTTIWT